MNRKKTTPKFKDIISKQLYWALGFSFLLGVLITASFFIVTSANTSKDYEGNKERITSIIKNVSNDRLELDKWIEAYPSGIQKVVIKENKSNREGKKAVAWVILDHQSWFKNTEDPGLIIGEVFSKEGKQMNCETCIDNRSQLRRSFQDASKDKPDNL